MADPNNHPEAIYPSFSEWMEYMDSLCGSKYPFSLDKELVSWLYRASKSGAFIYLHSWEVMETHLQRVIPLKAKKTMCLQELEAKYFDITIKDSDIVAYNSERHKPWCMQEWLLPSLGRLPNAFRPRFDSRSLYQFLSMCSQVFNEKSVYSFSYCHSDTRNIFCELLFMYLLVKHEDTPIEQMIKDYKKYQFVYEQYAGRQWRAQNKAGACDRLIMVPFIAKDLARIDAIDNIVD